MNAANIASTSVFTSVLRASIHVNTKMEINNCTASVTDFARTYLCATMHATHDAFGNNRLPSRVERVGRIFTLLLS